HAELEGPTKQHCPDAQSVDAAHGTFGLTKSDFNPWRPSLHVIPLGAAPPSSGCPPSSTVDEPSSPIAAPPSASAPATDGSVPSPVDAHPPRAHQAMKTPAIDGEIRRARGGLAGRPKGANLALGSEGPRLERASARVRNRAAPPPRATRARGRRRPLRRGD